MAGGENAMLRLHESLATSLYRDKQRSLDIVSVKVVVGVTAVRTAYNLYRAALLRSSGHCRPFLVCLPTIHIFLTNLHRRKYKTTADLSPGQ